MLCGPVSSGKSTFSKIYRVQNHTHNIHSTIHVFNKSKKNLYDKFCKVLTLLNIGTVGPKLNYSGGLVIIDDLSLPINAVNSNQNFENNAIHQGNIKRFN